MFITRKHSFSPFHLHINGSLIEKVSIRDGRTLKDALP